jgi:predicted nucleic acid-binding protein
LKTVYLDVSCLNRPFDDQRQARIRLEAEAVAVILERIDAGRYRPMSSQMTEIEIAAMRDSERCRRVTAPLPARADRKRVTPAMFARAAKLESLGFKPADALHVAAAEPLKVDVLLSCDERLCRRALARRSQLKVRVAKPLTWLKEHDDASDA